jgi:nucleoid DNA-binding protein
MTSSKEPIVSKEDFIRLVMEQFKDDAGGTVTIRDAELISNGVFKALSEAMKIGKVKVYKFGSFSRGIKPERNGRNPRTGAAITIPSRVFVKFKPSPNLKDDLGPVLSKEGKVAMPKETIRKKAKSKKEAAPVKAKPAAKKPADKPAAKAQAKKPVAKTKAASKKG